MGSFQEIGGAKGSSESTKSPTETPDSLISIAYAKVLDAISEGPIAGLANGNQSIFLNNTPLANADGSLNFTGVTVGTRTGEADQDYIPGFPSVESETAVGVELKFATPWVQTISNTELSAVRVRLAVPYLTYTDSNGNINGYKVDYAIDVATDSGAYVEVINSSFNGKTTSTYERTHRIDLPESSTGWRVRVRRLTEDSTTSNIQSTTNIASYTEIIDAKLRYPYTAMVGLTVDASQFSSIPSRAFDCKLRIVRVPSNYTPETRTYSGTWDGTFKLAWTDNPAWIYYDLILNDRYGLGQLITAAQVDKWGLYQIAGYCDEMVSDGKGGTEPRFACNLYLQTRADALQVLQDLASIFRGMAYWAAGSVVASADMPTDPVYTYTNANVIDGVFTYVGSARSTRFSVALVSWNDPTNFYEKKVEYVSDQKALARYGVQQTELSAFGCTSQGQAQRLGHYTLLTNLLENETVSFSAGLDGTIARPGQIIRVADGDRAGRRIGGRIKAATARTITLDADASVSAGDSVTVILPTGVAQTKTVTGYANRVVSVGSSWDSIPVAQSVFAIESSTLAAQTFRVLSVAENFSDTEMKYDITAVKHVAGKYAAIDNGAQIVQLPVTVIPASVQAPPTNIRLSSFTVIDQGIAATTMRAEWDAPANAVSYDVWWRRNSNDWVYAGRTYSASIEVSGIYAGTYLVRVAALNSLNAASIWAYSDSTDLAGKVGLPPAVTSLTTESLIFGIGLKWTFPPGAEDTQRTELWYSEAPQLESAIKLADLAYPQSDYTMMGLRAGQQFFFWARPVDRTGNVGPWFPADGTVIVGQASADADDILDYLTGKITESELGQELLGEIGKIGGEGPGSVNERLDEVRGELADVQTSLGEQITDVNNTVGQVQSELQAQIDHIADLADSMPYKEDETYTAGQGVLGADGIIYQATQDVPVNTPPPNATYWLNVGQAVQTANGLAARVTTAETKITSIEGVNTAQANQITGLQTSLDGKADSSVVSSLSSRVTTAEGTLSSQGTAITGLNNSLTTTNQNVTAAQNAANAANTLAGGKGKVIVQSSAPATADQLAQNLWIDTTNNANTPKRWTGSAWTAVTDKAATDAAAAAASALAQVATKAEASTVQALSNTVTQQGTAITANGAAVTTINANLSNVGGENLVYNPSFDIASGVVADGFALGIPSGASATASIVASTLDPKGKAQHLEVTTTSTTYADLTPSGARRPSIAEGQTIQLSVYVRGTAGMYARMYMQPVNSSGVVIATRSSSAFVLTENWQRITLDYSSLPAGTVGLNFILRSGGSSGVLTGFTEWDRVQVELGNIVTGWRDSNGTTDAAVAANATATTALTSRVTQAETSLTSVSGQLTQLSNSIGQTGGDNLLANSSFEQTPVADATRPLYWRTGSTSGATPTLTFVDSTLSSSIKAVRLTRAALANGNYIDLNWNAADGDQPKVTGGQTYTLSVHTRLSSSSARFAMYIQWMNAAGTVLSTSQISETAVGTTFTRLSLTATAPADAVKAHIFAGRLLNRSGAAADMWIELDNVQLQEGSTLTAYSPSVQAVTAAQSATSAAVDSLSSTVTQQGNTLTSVAARTTTLENSVNSTTDGLATKASASALTSMGNRVTSVEGVLTTQSSDITSLKNSIGNAAPFVAGYSWEMTGSVRGWVANVSGATITAGALFATVSGYTQIQATNSFGKINGSENPFLRIRLRRKNTSRATAAMYWANEDGGLAEARRFNWPINLNTEDWQDIELDLSANTAWNGKTGIYAIRLDMTNSADTAAVIDIGYIAVGRRSAAGSAQALSALSSTVTQQGSDITSASSRVTSLENSVNSTTTGLATKASNTALSSLQSTVTQQGNTLTSQGTSLTGLQSTVGNHTAQLQQQATTIADSAGKIAAAYSVRLNLSQNGLMYVAGFGVSLSNESGTTQSQFVVAADRFAVVTDVAGNVTSPFIIENGQAFIADAVIKKATIANGVVGQYLRSQAKTSSGEDVMTVDFVSGQVTTRHSTKANTYAQQNSSGVAVVVDGVLRVRMGAW